MEKLLYECSIYNLVDKNEMDYYPSAVQWLPCFSEHDESP